MSPRRAWSALRPALWLPALALFAGAPAAAEEAPVPATAGIPAGIPVALDGNVTPAEWADAAETLFSPAGPRLWIKQCRGTLLLAVLSDRPWPEGGRLTVHTRPGMGVGTADDPGALTLDFEPFGHDRPHALTTQRSAETGGPVPRVGAWVVRALAHGDRAGLEAAVPLPALGIAGREPPPLRWFAAWQTPGAADTFRTVPAGLDLRGPTGKPPPALASTARWAHAATWIEPGGAGAFSKTEWAAMVEADRELADRGGRAHALAVSLMDPARGEEPKVDAPIGRDILVNLAWIARREPWTRGDVRALAAGLWNLNRAAEAIAALGDAGAVSHPAADRGQDLDLLARVAKDVERYDIAASARERLADLIGAEHAAPHRAEADRLRALIPLHEAEQAARAADAAKDDQPLVRLRTAKGDVLLRLLEDDAPESVAQFVALCDAKTKEGKPFYEGLRWHRVVANGVAQTGDPTSRHGCDPSGAGPSPWTVAPEKPAKRRPFFRGSVGFAMDRMNRVGSQFFVVTSRKESFDLGEYPCFATVIAGMDVIDRLEACDALIGVDVLRRRPHAYEPPRMSEPK